MEMKLKVTHFDFNKKKKKSGTKENGVKYAVPFSDL
jgi:hypothetical protein